MVQIKCRESCKISTRLKLFEYILNTDKYFLEVYAFGII